MHEKSKPIWFILTLLFWNYKFDLNKYTRLLRKKEDVATSVLLQKTK